MFVVSLTKFLISQLEYVISLDLIWLSTSFLYFIEGMLVAL